MSVMGREIRAYWGRGPMVERITVVAPDGAEVEIPYVTRATRVVTPGELPTVTLEVIGRLVEVWEPDPSPDEDLSPTTGAL